MPSAGHKPLSEMKPGEEVLITELTIQERCGWWLLDLGFIPGRQ